MKKSLYLFFAVFFTVNCLVGCKHNPEPELMAEPNVGTTKSAIITVITSPENFTFDLYDNLTNKKIETINFQASAIGCNKLIAQWYVLNSKGITPEKIGTASEIEISEENCEYSITFEIPQINYLEAKLYCELSVSDEEGPYAKVETEKCTITQNMVNTGLPVAYINTGNYKPIDSKEVWCNNSTMQIVKTDGTTENFDMKIKGRGNATWGYPKKPYKIKLSDKSKVLGMNKNKDWVLLANYCDKTLLRSAIGFKTSELLNMPWSPDSKFVDLVLNGEYLGNYQLSEAVKKDSSRVNITENGYLIERDGYYAQEVDYFVTDNQNLGFSFKYPESEDNPDFEIQEEYIKNYVDALENVLYNEDDTVAFNSTDGYQKYLDMTSLCQFFLLHNILQNIDMNQYFFKNDNTEESKLCLGPAWDFEWSIGIGWYDGERPNPNNTFIVPTYYSRIIEDINFKHSVKSMWQSDCNSIEADLIAYIDSLSEELTNSQKFNFIRWNIMDSIVSVGGVPMGSYENEVLCDKQFLHNHIEWLNSQIGAW